jgi:hypothetical protein
MEMSSRSSVLARLRRARAGAARYVAALFAVAYLASGVAPCVAAASSPPAVGGAQEHVHHAHHEHGDSAAGPHHGHDAGVPSRHDSNGDSCPHCPLGGGPARGHDDHSTCAALDDLTNVASQAKAAPPALAPSLGPAAFTLPPPLASPLAPPPWRSASPSSVPLNIRHCVFLI